jgi:hypothetical protein
MTGKKAQTSMVLIVLMIVIFMAIGIFILLSSLKTEYEDYYNLYAHNLLLSVLRRSTGERGDCDTYGAAITCASTTDFRSCGGTNCRNFSATIVPELINRIIKEDLDYCMIAEPENVTFAGGERLLYGPRCDVVLGKSERWTANEKVLQDEFNIDIQMIITKS